MLRFWKLLPPVLTALVLCIPKVFTAFINGLGYTCNWISRQIGWDWHSLFLPEDRTILNHTTETHVAVGIFLGSAFLALVVACRWRSARGPIISVSVTLAVLVLISLLLTLAR